MQPHGEPLYCHVSLRPKFAFSTEFLTLHFVESCQREIPILSTTATAIVSVNTVQMRCWANIQWEASHEQRHAQQFGLVIMTFEISATIIWSSLKPPPPRWGGPLLSCLASPLATTPSRFQTCGKHCCYYYNYCCYYYDYG